MASTGASQAVRRRRALAATIAALAPFGATGALASQEPADLQVVDRNTGQPLQVWRHHGRLFVAGQPGAPYSLRVINHTDGRLLVVLSVDGVNIVSGETASYSQRGYVIAPHQSHDINGWRKSETEIAAFSFAPLPQSYAARTGRPSDVGVIGMAVFQEKVVPPAPVEVSPPPTPAAPAARDEAQRGGYRAPKALPNVPTIPPLPVPPVPQRVEEPAPPARAASGSPHDVVVTARRQEEKLGTAHGAREWSLATIVTFERATRSPQSVQQIEYDTYANLVASGVIPASPVPNHRPRPFPPRPGPEGYVPDPPPGF